MSRKKRARSGKFNQMAMSARRAKPASERAEKEAEKPVANVSVIEPPEATPPVQQPTVKASRKSIPVDLTHKETSTGRAKPGHRQRQFEQSKKPKKDRSSIKDPWQPGPRRRRERKPESPDAIRLRQQRHKEQRESEGLKQVRVWVPTKHVHRIKYQASMLRSGQVQPPTDTQLEALKVIREKAKRHRTNLHVPSLFMCDRELLQTWLERETARLG